MAALTRTLVLSSLLLVATTATAQRLVEWTEGAGELGLGYPVPIPVDTPLAFDGFRSYDGLHARHQALMLSLDEIDGTVVGTTIGERPIWAYLLGDPDAVTATGLPESAAMIQGGIHAREWQTPESVTAVMERLLERRDNDYLETYLLDTVNLVAIPVLNVDGFLQTQRYPSQNYIGADPTSASSWPRDGRMRRKNMRGVDEDISTVSDHLGGIDLNRNNPPFWATSTSSSSDSSNLVFHGSAPHSEPETQAMLAAVELAPGDRLRVFTDVHSFAQVFFSERTGNTRRDAIQTSLLADFANHHAQLPGNKRYFDERSFPGRGIGSTDEYFAYTFQIPSWTLETEPSGGSHPGLPGSGADYGGLGSNGHDGFILPEAEIRRVRDNLAESFIVTYYHQAGPPSVAAVRYLEGATGAVVYEAEWDVSGPTTRVLHQNVIEPLAPGVEYVQIVSFDKPMRWLEDGVAARLPGQPTSGLRVEADLRLDTGILSQDVTEFSWPDQPGWDENGWLRYETDTVVRRVTLTAPVTASTEATLEVIAGDMVGQQLDADPSTAVDWGEGHWLRYEGVTGLGDIGGPDTTLTVPLAPEAQPAFLVTPGHTAAWFDPEHAGEGFILEILDDGVAVIYWFTYDEAGAQRWFTGVGEIRGNEVVFEDLLVTTGGQFGPALDPAAIERLPTGQLNILFAGCDMATMRYGTHGKTYRQNLVRLSSLQGLGCGDAAGAKADRHLTGSWFDPDRAGEGFIVEALADGRALIYWFTYDPQGNQAWFVGDAPIGADGTVMLDTLMLTSGGQFGDGFDPATVSLSPWGSAQFDFDCDSATVEYQSDVPGYGSGSQSLIRLTRPSGLGECQ